MKIIMKKEKEIKEIEGIIIIMLLMRKKIKIMKKEIL